MLRTYHAPHVTYTCIQCMLHGARDMLGYRVIGDMVIYGLHQFVLHVRARMFRNHWSNEGGSHGTEMTYCFREESTGFGCAATVHMRFHKNMFLFRLKEGGGPAGSWRNAHQTLESTISFNV